MELDHVVVRTPDGIRHARVDDVPILLCGRAPEEGSRELPGERAFDCQDCRREAELRGDRSVGIVDA
ncbi:MAG: hypothetical protein ICV64_04420 [Thermoleophilia bacterium]|nr:hypothetical protein [Thermoleophilia bacterium]